MPKIQAAMQSAAAADAMTHDGVVASTLVVLVEAWTRRVLVTTCKGCMRRAAPRTQPLHAAFMRRPSAPHDASVAPRAVIAHPCRLYADSHKHGTMCAEVRDATPLGLLVAARRGCTGLLGTIVDSGGERQQAMRLN
jgi:hypothetical protein